MSSMKKKGDEKVMFQEVLSPSEFAVGESYTYNCIEQSYQGWNAGDKTMRESGGFEIGVHILYVRYYGLHLHFVLDGYVDGIGGIYMLTYKY